MCLQTNTDSLPVQRHLPPNPISLPPSLPKNDSQRQLQKAAAKTSSASSRSLLKGAGEEEAVLCTHTMPLRAQQCTPRCTHLSTTRAGGSSLLLKTQNDSKRSCSRAAPLHGLLPDLFLPPCLVAGAAVNTLQPRWGEKSGSLSKESVWLKKTNHC